MVDGHDRTDFWIQKNFGSGHFLIFFQISWIKKMPRAKKNINIKNQFFHARQPREEIFDIYSHLPCIFTISCQSLNGPQYSNFGKKCPKLGPGTPEDMLFTNLGVAA